MKLKIIRSYKTIYDDPIILKEGDRVTLGEEESKKEWLGWIRAESDNKKGWVPKEIVDTSDGMNGIVKEYYTARELDVEKGDVVIQLKELNGWVWVRHQITNEEGWIPKENTKLLKA